MTLNDSPAPISLALTIQVPAHHIVNAICSAVESCGYWAELVAWREPTVPITECVQYDAINSRPRVETIVDYMRRYWWPMVDGAIVFRDPPSPNELLLDRAAITSGLAIMAEKFPRLFGILLSGEADATPGDAFLQCCLFGDVIYG